MDNKLVLTTRETSEILGVSKTTLEHWRIEGRGPSFAKLGGRCFYRVSDLQAWIAANVCMPGSKTSQPQA